MISNNITYLDKIDEAEELHLNSVKSYFIDDEIYQMALENSQTIDLNEVNRINDEEIPFFNQLSKDFFNVLYKMKPEIYSKEDIYQSLHLEHDILTEMINNENFQQLKNVSSGNMFGSIISLKYLHEQSYKIIKEWMDKSKENEEYIDKINASIQKQNELAALLTDIENEEADENADEELKSLLEEIKDLNNLIASPKGNFKKKLTTLTNKIAKTVDDIQDYVVEFNSAAIALGLGKNKASNKDGNNNLNSVPFEQKRLLLEYLKTNDRFKKICIELGRIKESIGKLSKKPSSHGQIVCDIGTGDNLKKTLSTEKVKLLNKDTEMDFYKRFNEKTLLEYKTNGFNDYKGPIVVCLDVSGSMLGDSEIWSKAVAIASLQLAISQKRNYRCITFNSRVTNVIDVNADSDILEESLKISNVCCDGGTSFEEPLKSALESISESKFKKADILFITDGYPYGYLCESFETKFNKIKNDKNFTVQSILIGSTTNDYLNEFSDKIINFSDFTDNKSLEDIFTQMKFNESNNK